ncbi:MAG: FKBP-type peptidyl-prolyl cis-trans isomerase [Tannerellaceae bacterium]|nr:FKBP-type peptidyl-prolyl cis-trans isomerase [Tannerellaceae bacterium]
MMKKELVFSFLLCLCCTFFMGCKDDDDDNGLAEDPAWTAANEAKLAEIAKDPEYQKVESFQQKGVFMYYKVLESGDGERPVFGMSAKVEYEGRFYNGEVFDSQLLVDGVITKYWDILYSGTNKNIPIVGWVEILQHMQVGDRWDVWIPASLGYGTRGNTTILPNTVLNFEMELLDVK